MIQFLEVALTSVVAILFILGKLATLGLLKVTDFWDKSYDVITYIYEVINKILTCDLL